MRCPHTKTTDRANPGHQNNQSGSPGKSDCPRPIILSSLRPCSLLGDLTTKSMDDKATPRDTAGNKTAPSLKIKNRKAPRDATKSTIVTHFHPPEEPEELRMDKARPTKTKTSQHRTTMRDKKTASTQVLYVPASHIKPKNNLPNHTEIIGKPRTKEAATNTTTTTEDKAVPETLATTNTMMD